MLYLFDIDGTLIGGDGSGRRAFERACHEELGIMGALEHLRLDGMTDPLIVESVVRHHHERAATDEEMRAIFAVYLRHLESEIEAGLFHVKPAVHETLDHLERGGATIGLATGNLAAGARIKLQRGDLWRRFAFGGFGDDAPATTNGRTELVRTAMRRGAERAGRSFGRDEIWVIGDTPKDVTAAHAAGARAVGVATGWYTLDQLRETGAEAVHPTLTEWLATL